LTKQKNTKGDFLYVKL